MANIVDRLNGSFRATLEGSLGLGSLTLWRSPYVTLPDKWRLVKQLVAGAATGQLADTLHFAIVKKSLVNMRRKADPCAHLVESQWHPATRLFEPLSVGEPKFGRADEYGRPADVAVILRSLPSHLEASRVLEITCPAFVWPTSYYLHWGPFLASVGIYMSAEREENHGDVTVRIPSQSLMESALRYCFPDRALRFCYTNGPVDLDDINAAHLAGFHPNALIIKRNRYTYIEEPAFDFAAHEWGHLIHAVLGPGWVLAVTALYYSACRSVLNLQSKQTDIELYNLVSGPLDFALVPYNRDCVFNLIFNSFNLMARPAQWDKRDDRPERIRAVELLANFQRRIDEHFGSTPPQDIRQLSVDIQKVMKLLLDHTFAEVWSICGWTELWGRIVKREVAEAAQPTA